MYFVMCESPLMSYLCVHKKSTQDVKNQMFEKISNILAMFEHIRCEHWCQHCEVSTLVFYSCLHQSHMPAHKYLSGPVLHYAGTCLTLLPKATCLFKVGIDSTVNSTPSGEVWELWWCINSTIIPQTWSWWMQHLTHRGITQLKALFKLHLLQLSMFPYDWVI